LNWALVALVCLGVWLHAADALVATTVMPSAIAEIGGLPLIYWTIALYELGSIIAGALAGIAAVALELRSAMTASALAYALGCAASALAPSMPVMLAGRLVQGLGGGAMLALSYVGVSQLFPERLWTRVLAIVSGVWGVSSLVGPLVGGIFASAGLWRGAFWAFGAQALVLVVLTPLLVGAHETPPAGAGAVPGRQIVALAAGVLAISFAGVQADVRGMAALASIGGGILLLVLRLERTARTRLFPPAPLGLRAPWGAGYVMVLTLATATVSFTVYGPLLMTRLFHVGPLTAGFMVATESIAWTLAALVFARATPSHEPALIRIGALLVVAGIVALAVAMPRGPVVALLPGGLMQGAGFGMSWGFVLRRIVASVAPGERERASAAMPTFQMIGYAVGAAASGIVANALGLTETAPVEVARSVGYWVFAAFLPLGLVGVGAAFRIARDPRHSRLPAESP
jgi:MFS family permease